MRIARVLFVLVIATSQVVFPVPSATADDMMPPSNIVIAQMYPGTYSGELKDQEFIEIYNNSDTAVDVTNWCVKYIPYTGNPTSDSVITSCLTPPNTNTKLWLGARGYAVFISNEFKPTTHADVYFDGGISQRSGYVQLVDQQANEVDKLGWGSVKVYGDEDGTYPAFPKDELTSGNALQRKHDGDVMQEDTGNDGDDFMSVDAIIIHASSVYEEETIIDECPNLEDTNEIPEGYFQDDERNCHLDSCLNLDGPQFVVPVGYDSDANHNCTQHDECDNLPDTQTAIPDLMIRGEDNDCVIDHSPLELTEILPNADGSDIGNEFIEIHNSGDTTINLTYYAIKIGGNSKIYSFPIGASIGPGEYRSFSDSEMKFTLVNTSSRVVLTAIGDVVFGDTGVYTSPAEDESWALINSNWQYTNRPTPGAKNLVSIQQADSGSSASSPKPCEANHYRSPETGRCRKIKTTTRTPCKANQYRSEETGRCRKVLGASTRKPCKANQYRSEETGRCRKLPNSTVPDAAFAVQPIKDTGVTFVGWWALGGIGLLAIGYGAWEWRQELVALWLRLMKRS